MLERHDRLETLRKLKELQERIAELAYLLTGEEPAAWTPRVDLLETEEHYVLLVDLPGVRPEDLELLEEGQRVTWPGCATPARHLPLGGEAHGHLPPHPGPPRAH